METASHLSLRPRRHKVKGEPAEPLTCWFYDCTTRFLVSSESRPDEVHLVDLDSDCGVRFECSCEDFRFRNPDWAVAPVPYECKHIFRAKEFIKQLAEGIIEEERMREKYRNAPDL